MGSLPGRGAYLKRYDELYREFTEKGYTKELCEAYAESFVDDSAGGKKPPVADILQLSRLYGNIRDYKNSEFYLDMLSEKKLGGEERLGYCEEMLRTLSMLGRWRDGDDFRTENINFIQTYMAKKKTPDEQAGMYIALALCDCAAKRYVDAFRLLNYGYKPKGRNDVMLLDIFTTAVYVYAKSGDSEGVEAASANAFGCLNLFKDFPFKWSRDYYEKRIRDAAEGIL